MVKKIGCKNHNPPISPGKITKEEIDDWFDKTLKDIVEKDRDIIEALS